MMKLQHLSMPSACTALLVFMFAVLPSASAEEAFIDGFPDIPRLEIVAGIEGEAVIFDTASGTVAEVGLYITVPAAQAFSSYSNTLNQLGWTCKLRKKEMTCVRADSTLSLLAPTTPSAKPIFILRLEPRL